MSLIRTLWRCTFSPRLYKIYEVTWIGLVDVSTTHLFSVSPPPLGDSRAGLEVTRIRGVAEIVRAEEPGAAGRPDRHLRKCPGGRPAGRGLRRRRNVRRALVEDPPNTGDSPSRFTF